ncbi:MAG: formylglycine-generating enzyme family protein [Mojavia pulchra JT2-VF2]|jgi:formylglycine-generating enzyme required for sulfatase activity|uniref:Formylglycine-generating enzyme family protein n=1 Tax=Mojavia pulchra JT2-VF2 TaxID=287848 RepID=A0A951PW89_9NOST|nr:formylglycine-generating enzyme family protein [Mojavia pulchra JT2-VF2]
MDIEFVLVDNTENPADPITNSGKVDYIFQIGKYQITNTQYADFLNAVAAYSDPYNLYNVNMERGLFGGIKRTKKDSCYFYEPLEGYCDLPVVYVSWFDAARFCNWLHFGKPKLGESILGTTEGNSEIGAYNTSLFSDGREIQEVKAHNPEAKYWIPTLDEWNKAAYFDPSKNGSGGYWLYPTRSDTKPQAIAPPGDQFSANYYDFKWAAPELYLTPVGSYKYATSYYGTYDQGGNVWEWVETLRGNHHRWVRGGGATTFDHALSRLNVDSEYSDHKLYIFGFRVAKNAE